MHARLLPALAGTLLTAAVATATSLIDVDDNAATLTGTWTKSTTVLVFYGDDYAVAQGGGSTDRATFNTPAPIDRTGRWCVQARWTAAPNRFSAAQFVVNALLPPPFAPLPIPLGTFTADMRRNGGAWQQLGCFNMSTGFIGQVVLSDAGAPAGTFVVADAVRWVRDSAVDPGIEFRHNVGARNLSTVVTCTGSTTMLDTVSLTAPAAGFVLVQSTGRVTVSGGNVVVTIDPTIPFTGESDASLSVSSNWSLQRVYPVDGGTRTFGIRSCRSAGATGAITPMDLVATYFPTRY